jgi:hypothetical protein
MVIGKKGEGWRRNRVGGLVQLARLKPCTYINRRDKGPWLLFVLRGDIIQFRREFIRGLYGVA